MTYKNFGDISIWHNQTWIAFGGDDYAECVETISSFDLETLADNQLRIERGSIYFSPRNWDSALDCCGIDRIGPPEYYELAYAFKAYQGVDSEWVEIVQFGKNPITDFMQRPWDVETANTILHGNKSAENYLEEEYLDV